MSPSLSQEAVKKIHEAIPSPQHLGVEIVDTECPVLGKSKASVVPFFYAGSMRVMTYPEKTMHTEQMLVVSVGEFSGRIAKCGVTVTQIYDDGVTLTGMVLDESESVVEKQKNAFIPTGKSKIFRDVHFDLSFTIA